MPKYEFVENYFEVIDNGNKAYWLGFLFADGCIMEMKLPSGKTIPQTVQISLGIKDIEILYKFMKDIDLQKNIYIGTATYDKGRESSQYCRLQIGSSKMCSDLISYGCIPRKTHKLEFPNNLPTEFINDFIRGFFDGNGSVFYSERIQFDKRRNKSYIQKKFGCGFDSTYKFLEVLKYYLELNNIKTGEISKGHGEIYRLEFGAKESIVNFFRYIYEDADIYLERKFNKFIDTFKYLDMAV
jgi:hypothetical protein